MNVVTAIESWPVKRPLVITGHTFDKIDLLTVTVSDDDIVGRGEGYGIYYLGETPQTMVAQIDALRPRLNDGITRDELRTLLPNGGARNALDCALWELECKRQNRSACALAGIAEPKPVPTTRTLFGDDPEETAAVAVGEARDAPRLKLKLLGDSLDAERVRHVRKARNDARLFVDANQAFNPAQLTELLPALQAAGVEMIEQPFPRGNDEWLDDFVSSIPIASDESVLCLADMETMDTRWDIVNIKLDKCGGLTEALLMAEQARKMELRVMVGCMISTSLSMAPAFVVAQLADIADVDGPLYLTRDREPAVVYDSCELTVPETLWGRRSTNEQAA